MKVIQITDMHLCKNPEERIFGLVNTNDTFLDVVAKIIEEKPDFIIATGDLSQDGSIESYQRLKEVFLTFNCDIFIIDGNHDNPFVMNKILVSNNIKHQEYHQTDEGTFIFCSSFKEESNSGLISDLGLINLEKYLNKFDNCIIVIHHHFVKLNTFVDESILENSEVLLSLLNKYHSKIKLCITGHVHNSYDINYNNRINIHSSLSTCIQFGKTESILFDFKSPGYTIYNFFNGAYEISEKTI